MNDSPHPSPEDLLATGLAQFNRGEFYEQHETLETLWRDEPRPVRRLYQGILQIGVAFYQVRRRNFHGAVVMLERGLRNIGPFESANVAIDVARLAADARRAHAAIVALGRERLADFDWSLAPQVHVLERSQE
jgi:hypothetical protein